MKINNEVKCEKNEIYCHFLLLVRIERFNEIVKFAIFSKERNGRLHEQIHQHPICTGI